MMAEGQGNGNDSPERDGAWQPVPGSGGGPGDGTPEADTDDNPKPAVKDKRGRLQSIDDLLRIPGGRWTPERLYDVKDPDVTEDETASGTQQQSTADGVDGDPNWERQNGVPGLARYLTVFAEDTPKPSVKINVNTATVTMLKALFESNDKVLDAERAIKRAQLAVADELARNGVTP